MLLIDGVNESRRVPLPEGYNAMGLKDKLYFIQSDIPAVTHLDYSARIQTVSRGNKPPVPHAPEGLQKADGLRGDPEHELQCAGRANRREARRRLHVLYENGNGLPGGRKPSFDKRKQPPWQESDDWKSKYELD